MPSLHIRRALLPEGWMSDVRVSLVGARIGTIETGVPAGPDDERHAIALPGMPNLHSHAFQRGMAGLAERRGPATDSFWTWREEMYRFLRVLDPDDAAAIAAQAYAEMLESGFTRVGEFHYLHHDIDGRPYGDLAAMASAIASAAADTGIGLTLLPCFYAHGGFGGAAPNEGQRRFICDLDKFSRLVESSRAAIASQAGANLGIAPHSLRAVTPEELSRLLELHREGPIHIHASEQVKEVEDCVAWSGRRPVEWLLERGADARWCLIHSTHMTDDETSRLAATGAVAGLCPITEANLGDGLFNGDTFRDADGRLGVGTDSNVLISAAGELRQLEYAQRLRLRLRNVFARNAGASTGRYLLDKAVGGGAQALGLPASGIALGALADIVTLDPAHPALVERNADALIDGWIFAAATSPVDCVWSLGRKVVSGGRHVAAAIIKRRFAATIAKVLAA